MLGTDCGECCPPKDGWYCYVPNAGACCEGAQCNKIRKCECDTITGAVFKGIGTVCDPNPCGAGCYVKKGYRAILFAKGSNLCASCPKSKLVGDFATFQEASDALSSYRASVLNDPECSIPSEEIIELEIAAGCYESAPDDTWTLKSTHQTRNECESRCGKESCPRGICIKTTKECFRRDCPDNPDNLIPVPCSDSCGSGDYYEWECYKFAPGETIADYQWAVDDYEGYEVDWCTETYFNAIHYVYMPIDKCPADAAQYWPDAACPLGCRQQQNPLP